MEKIVKKEKMGVHHISGKVGEGAKNLYEKLAEFLDE